MKTDLTITTTSATDNKKVTNKISYVNPNLSNNQAIELAQAITNLTTDSYSKTTRTDTTECDETKIPRVISSVISVTGSTVTLEGGVYKIQAPQSSMTTGNPRALTINVDSAQFNPLPIYTPRLADVQITGGFKFYSWRLELRNSGNPRISCYFTQANTPEVGETVNGTIIVPADENFAELDIPFEITVTAGGD